MRRRTRQLIDARAERGAIAITAAIWIIVAVAALGVIDVGHFWWEKRNLQGVADMMALAGAQRLDDTCGGSQSIVAQSAASNGFTGAYTVQCGRYDIASRTFSAEPAPFASVNAINVTISSNVDYWFLSMLDAAVGKSGAISVQSVSRVVNIDAFTLGTTVAAVQSGNSALLNGVLSSLLGSSVNLSVASYNDLAAAQVRLTDLAAQINSNGANDIVEMLSGTPTLQTLLTAIRNAVPAGDPSRSVLTQLAGAANTAAGGTTVPMDGSNGKAGLLDVGLENKNGASNATIDALDAVMVAAMVANTTTGNTSSGVAPISLSIASLSAIPGLSGNVQVSLGQPPVLAVGEAGTSATIARSSQIRLLLDLGVASSTPGSLLGVLPPAFTVSVPLYLAVGNGEAKLTKTQCGAGVNDSWAQMQVQPSLVQACVADNASALFHASTTGTAPSCGNTATIATISLLGSGVLSLSGVGGSVQLQPQPTQISFTGVGHQIVSQNPVTATSNDLGQVLASAVGYQQGSLLYNLASTLQVSTPIVPGIGALLSFTLTGVLDLLQPVVTNVIGTTVASVLSTAVPPLLNLLGAQIGSATVTDLSLTCGNVQLVQ